MRLELQWNVIVDLVRDEGNSPSKEWISDLASDDEERDPQKSRTSPSSEADVAPARAACPPGCAGQS